MKHMYNNFGDIGMAVKDLVDDFQRHNTQGRNVNTLEDMQNFVDNYSEFSAAQRNASKHVTLISTLSNIVDTRTLMQVHNRLKPHSACRASLQYPFGLIGIYNSVLGCRCRVQSRKSHVAVAIHKPILRWSTSLSTAPMSRIKTGYG